MTKINIKKFWKLVTTVFTIIRESLTRRCGIEWPLYIILFISVFLLFFFDSVFFSYSSEWKYVLGLRKTQRRSILFPPSVSQINRK